MKLPGGMTPEEIRILQEFRRLQRKQLTLQEITAVKHPVDRGEEPLRGLVEKSLVTSDGTGQAFTLTGQAEEFLAYNPVPENEETE